MKIPFGNQDVTLIHRTEYVVGGKTSVLYSCIHLSGCSWIRKHVRNVADNSATYIEEVTCRIPHEQTKPNLGDLLILGNVTENVSGKADYQGLIEKYKQNGAFIAESIDDFDKKGFPIPHYCVKG